MINQLISFIKDKIKRKPVGFRLRSSKWPKVRQCHLQSQNKCQYCGNSEELEVHHIKPFHLFPEMELDTNNLITLCEDKKFNCHIKMGHNGNWKSYNDHIKQDCDKKNKRGANYL